MRFDDDPVFRKIIVAWYDSEATCYLILAAMLPVMLFSMAGISVALETPEYGDYIWVPLLLLGLSGYMTVVAAFRLLSHYSRQ